MLPSRNGNRCRLQGFFCKAILNADLNGLLVIRIFPTCPKAPPALGAERDKMQLRSASVNTVVVTGGETDVCALTTVLGAIDWGFGSFSPQMHAAPPTKRRTP